MGLSLALLRSPPILTLPRKSAASSALTRPAREGTDTCRSTESVRSERFEPVLNKRRASQNLGITPICLILYRKNN
jgi:hypothetical protein